MTYDDWYQSYLQLYKRKLADKTRESYARIAQLVSPVLGSLELQEISPDHVQLALLTVEERAGSRQAQIAYALIHACLARACRSRRLPYNPADAVDKPEHEAREGRVIEGEDYQLLKPIIEEDLALSLMAYAGLRRGEVLGLRRGDIDLKGGLIHVERQRLRVKGCLQLVPPKSSAGVRDVPIEAELLPILSRLPLLHPNALLVPCAPETLDRRWKRAQAAEGIVQPYRLHDLRHTYATRQVIKGCNLRILQYIIGHSSYDLTVRTYTHIGAKQAKDEIYRISAALH